MMSVLGALRPSRLIGTITHWFNVRFTDAGKFVLSITLLSGAMGVDTGKTTAYQIFSLLGLIMATSFVLTLRFKADIRVRRILPRYCTSGRALVYKVQVTNEGKSIERGLELIDVYTESAPVPMGRQEFWDWALLFMRDMVQKGRGNQSGLTRLSDLKPGTLVEAELTLHPRARGRMHMLGMLIARTDPFGLMRAMVRVPMPESVAILPERFEVAEAQVSGTRRHHAGGVPSASSVGDSEEFHSLRDYTPGDPPRLVAWKIWAHTGRPVTKKYQEEFYARQALVLDTFGAAGRARSFEAAVSAAASMLLAREGEEETLLDLVFVEDEVYTFTSGRGMADASAAMELLSSVHLSTLRPFGVLVGSVVERAEITSGAVCVLLSWDEERRGFMERLRAGQLDVRALVVRDRKGEEEMLMLDPPVIAAHRDAVDKALRRLMEM